jgi:hypothetical protein
MSYGERLAGHPEQDFYAELVTPQRLEHERRSPSQKGLAMWTEAELVTPEVLEQLPKSWSNFPFTSVRWFLWESW